MIEGLIGLAVALGLVIVVFKASRGRKRYQGRGGDGNATGGYYGVGGDGGD